MTILTPHYNPDAYDFPDESMLSLSCAELRAILAEEIPMVDGSHRVGFEHVDYAEDIAQQARDLLLDRGEIFSDDEIRRLSFLKWPLSPEEEIRREAQSKREQAAHAAYLAESSSQSELALQKTRQAISGELSGRGADVAGVKLKLSGRGSVRSGCEADSLIGPNVRDLVQRLHTYGVPSAEIRSYQCFKPMVTFDTDPDLAWSVAMDLPIEREVWGFLVEWCDRHGAECPTVEVDWYHEGEPGTPWHQLTSTAWSSLWGGWPEPKGYLEFTQALVSLSDEPFEASFAKGKNPSRSHRALWSGATLFVIGLSIIAFMW